MDATFPIMNEGYPSAPSSVPWDFIKNYSSGAFRNHNQSLERLAERGGLSVPELLAVIENRKYERMEPAGAAAILKRYLVEFEAKQGPKWTKELPNKEGFYWMRPNPAISARIKPIKVAADFGGELYVCDAYSLEPIVPVLRYAKAEYDWAGPIIPPIN